jgi:hypothetical protein
LSTIYAYPAFTEYHGINITPISFLIIDLDLKDFGVHQEDSEKRKDIILTRKGFKQNLREG